VCTLTSGYLLEITREEEGRAAEYGGEQTSVHVRVRCECSVPSVMMDFLLFKDVSLVPISGIGHLCEDLNNIVGQGHWYDEYKALSTKWLELVSDIVEAMNNDTVLCGCFDFYPSYVADILTSVKSIDFLSSL
jgi:hypothetical protein